MKCPAGLKCYGNATTVPVALEYGESVWSTEIDITSGKMKLNLIFCPTGYYIQGTISTPGQLQCKRCDPGFECTKPPCHGACTECRPGFYKALKISHLTAESGSSFDNISASYIAEWMKEPCASCPLILNIIGNYVKKII